MYHLTTFPSHCATYYEQPEKQAKIPCLNLVENPQALGFHQEQTWKQWKIQQKYQKKSGFKRKNISGLVLYQTLCYLLDAFHLKSSKVEDKGKEKFLLQVSVTIQKFKIQKSLL